MKRYADPWAPPTPAEAAAGLILEVVRGRREGRGLSATALGELAGLSKASVTQYETGGIASIGLINLIKLCDALDCDVAIVPRETPNPAWTRVSQRWRNLLSEGRWYEHLLHCPQCTQEVRAGTPAAHKARFKGVRYPGQIQRRDKS